MDWLSLNAWFLIPILIGTFLYWYLRRNFDYWEKRGLKGPKPRIGFGNFLDQALTPMPVLESNWYKSYGKLYGVFYGNEPVLTVADTELIKTIFVKDFNKFMDRRKLNTKHPIVDKNLPFARGEDWKRLRSIISPTFTSGKLKKMYPLIRECVQSFLEHLEPFAEDRKDINLTEFLGKYTMDVIATCAFAIKINPYKDANNPFIVNARKSFNPKFIKIFVSVFFPPFLNKLLNNKSFLDEKANQFFFSSIRHIMSNRRRAETKYNDFIQLLMNAEKNEESIHDENDIKEENHVNDGKDELIDKNNDLNINIVKKNLNEAEIIAQAYVFFLAGYETTATTLIFCLYELALNPECQQKLYEEVNSAVDSNGDISFETLAKLPYLNAVLSETLRFYPPIMRLDRESMNDYKLGDTGITLYRGQIVEIPIRAIHHSEQYFPNPENFDPKRFLPENRDQIIPFTFLPFGAGPRNCIGERFALIEAKLCLAQIVRIFRIVKSPKTEYPLKIKKFKIVSQAVSATVRILKR